jgi:hypothetical protein
VYQKPLPAMADSKAAVDHKEEEGRKADDLSEVVAAEAEAGLVVLLQPRRFLK